MNKVNLTEKFSQFSDHWNPKVVGELNGQHVKLAKLKGQFVWHKHDIEDELFYVVKGDLDIELRNKVVHLKAGEFFIVNKGVEHRPVARKEVHVLLFEPVSTINTGNNAGDFTRNDLESL
ncbi:MAG: mannose-6-phosphate isomerase [Bacteroidetes bacterium]|nr:MAG: mannose-6-phosphate isomerase [Bacteroidota bacterium]